MSVLQSAAPGASVMFFTHSLSGGGTQNMVRRLSESLARSGYRVAIVCQVAVEGNPHPCSPSVEYHVLDAAHVLTSIVPFAQYARRWRPDVVISTLAHNNLGVVIARMISFARWRLVLTEHAPIRPLIAHYARWRYTILPIAIRLLYPLADAVVGVSQGIVDELTGLAPGLKRLSVIYNPILDDRVLEPSASTATTPAADAGAAERVPIIVTIGRISSEKDLPLLLRAFARLRARRPARLQIIGDGPDLGRITELAAGLAVRDDIEFPGWIDDPSGAMKAASVLALTSRFEGFGNVLVEAMSCGTPVVATDCPVGPREILDGGRFGKLVPVGDELALAAALEETIDHPPDPEFLRTRSRVFSYSASLNGYTALIDTLLSPRRRPAGGERPFRVSIYMNDLDGGGVERVTLLLVGSLRDMGVDVTLLLHSTHGQLENLVPAGARVIGFDTRRTIDDLPHLWRHLRDDRPDLLMSSLNHNNVVAVLAAATSLTGTPVIICQHNSLSVEARTLGWKYRVIPTCYRLLAPFMSAIVAVSRGVADDLHEATGIRRDSIATIYNPVIDSHFRERAAAPVDHPWFQDRESPIFVTAGRLVGQKDQATLLRALAELNKTSKARLLILGTGPLKAALEAQVELLGLQDNVSFLGFQENPLPYYREADAFVLSSRHEGLGNVLIEAMACGTPVISTDCPHGPAEILKNGQYGLLVPVGDSTALAAAMGGGRWRDWEPDLLLEAVQKYSVETVTREYLELMRRTARH